MYRFIYNFCNYVEAVGTEAGLRAKNEILDITTYISFRRETSALRLTFDLVQYCLGIDLPQYVHDDPVFASGYNAAMDLVCWTNVRIQLFIFGYLSDSLSYRIFSPIIGNRPKVMLVRTL